MTMNMEQHLAAATQYLKLAAKHVEAADQINKEASFATATTMPPDDDDGPMLHEIPLKDPGTQDVPSQIWAPDRWAREDDPGTLKTGNMVVHPGTLYKADWVPLSGVTLNPVAEPRRCSTPGAHDRHTWQQWCPTDQSPTDHVYACPGEPSEQEATHGQQ